MYPVSLENDLAPPHLFFGRDSQSLRSQKERTLSRQQTSNSVDLPTLKKLRTSQFGFSMTSLLGSKKDHSNRSSGLMVLRDSGENARSPLSARSSDSDSFVQTNQLPTPPARDIQRRTSRGRSFFNRLSSVIRFRSPSSRTSETQQENTTKQRRLPALHDQGLVHPDPVLEQRQDQYSSTTLSDDDDDLEFQCKGESAATRIKQEWESRNSTLADDERQKFLNFRFGTKSAPSLVITESGPTTLARVAEASMESLPTPSALQTPSEGLFESSLRTRSRPPSLRLAPFPCPSDTSSPHDPDFNQALLVPLPLSPLLSPMLPPTYDSRLSAEQYFPLCIPLPPSPAAENSPMEGFQTSFPCHSSDNISFAPASRSRSTSESEESYIATPTDASHSTLESALNWTGGRLRCSARPKTWASEHGHSVAIVVDSPIEDTMGNRRWNIDPEDEITVSSSAVIVVHDDGNKYAASMKTSLGENQASSPLPFERRATADTQSQAFPLPKPPPFQRSDSESAVYRVASLERTFIDNTRAVPFLRPLAAGTPAKERVPLRLTIHTQASLAREISTR
ncbi:hypothetical protein VNI00_013617 [Paramarasmius palmivorus]|uniref:Uncharacterized protein n=1 Tax=Paramarasmius palmivorus TaxID=297713 RepID=A0AAW0BVP8_9AGAR